VEVIAIANEICDGAETLSTMSDYDQSAPRVPFVQPEVGYPSLESARYINLKDNQTFTSLSRCSKPVLGSFDGIVVNEPGLIGINNAKPNIRTITISKIAMSPEQGESKQSTFVPSYFWLLRLYGAR